MEIDHNIDLNIIHPMTRNFNHSLDLRIKRLPLVKQAEN